MHIRDLENVPIPIFDVRLPITLGLWEGGTTRLEANFEWIFDKDLYGLEDSIAAIRIFDVCRAMMVAKLIKGVDETDIELYAKGSFSFYGAQAKLIDGDAYSFISGEKVIGIAELIRQRFYQREQLANLILPGMLKYTDICDLEDAESS